MVDLPHDATQKLERAGRVVDAAVAMLDRYPEEYRVTILESLLAVASGAGWATRPPSPITSATGRTDTIAAEKGGSLAEAAAVAGVDQADLERIVHLGDDGFVKLLLQVHGRSVAERANRAAAIYCFIKEHGFGERDVEIEELRRVCVEQKAYNAPNFARNLQTSPWLLVIGEPRSRHKEYRLSAEGEQEAKASLRELLGA
ncbi:MAG: hypothetical protein F4X13_10040 [Gammaproteobacteria bacterium]|nr:hypothetical protein [Gammaproteobacteria bacterium]